MERIETRLPVHKHLVQHEHGNVGIAGGMFRVTNREAELLRGIRDRRKLKRNVAGEDRLVQRDAELAVARKQQENECAQVHLTRGA